VPDSPFQHPRFWKFYRTASGASPVREFLDSRNLPERAAIDVRMRRVQERGTIAARHLRGDIYEVKIPYGRLEFRILFAAEGRYNQVLLAVEAFPKKTQTTPGARIELAEARLAEHRSRAQPKAP
jgi:phage-related protein